MAPPIELCARLAGLDSLDIPLLVFDKTFKPRFLSSCGAQLFQIPNRSELEKYETNFAPLTELAKSAKRELTDTALIGAREGASALTPVQLTTADRRPFAALAYPRPFLFFENEPGAEHDGSAVVFHRTTVFAPFREVIERSRRIRSAAIACSVLAFEKGWISSLDAGLSKMPVGDALPMGEPSGVDLSQLLMDAVHVFDYVSPPSVRVATEGKTSALVIGHPSRLLALLCHALLEAADYIGPGGTMKIRTVLDAANQRLPGDRTNDSQFAEVVILGQRSAVVSRHLEPMEKLFYSLSTSSAHRVAVRESTGEENGSKDLTIPDAFSENLRLAQGLADSEGAVLQVSSGRADQITLTLQLRLKDRQSRAATPG